MSELRLVFTWKTSIFQLSCIIMVKNKLGSCLYVFLWTIFMMSIYLSRSQIIMQIFSLSNCKCFEEKYHLLIFIFLKLYIDKDLRNRDDVAEVNDNIEWKSNNLHVLFLGK